MSEDEKSRDFELPANTEMIILFVCKRCIPHVSFRSHQLLLNHIEQHNEQDAENAMEEYEAEEKNTNYDL